MRDLLPFIVSGIATGSIYGLAGTGLVLTYKTSGIFNFAHGALATAAAYLFYFLHVDHGYDWKLAFFVAVFVAGPVMGLAMEIVARRLSRQRTAWKIVGPIGLLLLVQALATVKYGSDPIRVMQFLPKGTETFRFGGVNILFSQLIVTVVGVVAVLALYALFRFSRAGIAMRAVVDDPDLVAMQAINPIRVRRTSWIVGSTFAALSGVLVLPFIGLNAIALTFLVVEAFGAAAVGAFGSIPLTFIGGLAIGIAADVSTKYVVSVSWLSGLPSSLPFVALFVVLLVLPRRKLVPPSALEDTPAVQWRAPGRVQAVMAVVILVPLLLVPQIVSSAKLGFFTVGLTQMIMLLSLGLLVRLSGQVSLCHAAFAAIGAVAFSQLAVEHGVPWLLALLIASLIVVPVGALVAIPAIRLSGLFLALATFGFGIMIQQLLYARGLMFTTLVSGRSVPRPSFATDDVAFYYVVLAFVVATAVLMLAIRRARLGRILQGMSESPVAVTTLGLSTNTTRVIVFCISAFLAGTSGILYSASIHFATSSDVHFMSFNSLILLAVLALAPFAEPWYALFALISAVVPGYITSGHTTSWLNALFGVFALRVALMGGPKPMPQRLRSFFERFGRSDQRAAAQRDVAPGPPIVRREPSRGLEVIGLGVRFGGLVAVDNLSFNAPTGRITGLIGPNGAGKTTTFDACSGLNRRVTGEVRLHGVAVTKLGPAARGRRGIGRTFQRMQLGDSLTVAQNVALGCEASLAGSSPLSQIAASRRESRAVTEATAAALELCGISGLADRQAGSLSTGQRRLVELARCLGGPFDILLLDEPSSGLDRDETTSFDEVLRHVVDERGCGVLLVEHDMSLVMNVCDYIYVLDFGKPIFEGDPVAVASSEAVKAAYLGDDSVLVARAQEATP